MYSLRSLFSRQSWVAFSARPVICGLDLCTLSIQRHSKCSEKVSLLLQWLFWYNVSKILLTTSLRRFFRLEAFHPLLVILSLYRCAQNFDIVKYKFFSYPSCLIMILINSFFDRISRKFLKTNGPPLLGLSSQDFLFDCFVNPSFGVVERLEISLTWWPDDRKNLPEV